jgi:hypothetical protein
LATFSTACFRLELSPTVSSGWNIRLKKCSTYLNSAFSASPVLRANDLVSQRLSHKIQILTMTDDSPLWFSLNWQEKQSAWQDMFDIMKRMSVLLICTPIPQRVRCLKPTIQSRIMIGNDDPTPWYLLNWVENWTALQDMYDILTRMSVIFIGTPLFFHRVRCLKPTT